MASLRGQVAALPESPGVYAFRDERGRLLYVGKSVNLKRRAESYLKHEGGHTGYTRKLKRVASRIEHIETGSELEALLVEARVIREDQPLYNVTGRHARRYAFVKVTAERFPRVQVTREVAIDGARYWGPFPPEFDLDAAIAGLQGVMKWRSCATLEARPCLHYELKSCLAPCLSEKAPLYDPMMGTLTRLLAGEGPKVLEEIAAKMAAAAQRLDFERAAKLRDRLRALSGVLDRAPLLTLDAVIVTRRKSAVRLLAIRAGRLVASRDVGAGAPWIPRNPPIASFKKGVSDVLIGDWAPPGALGDAIAFLGSAWQGPPPGAASRPEELREIDVVTGYLDRHLGDPDVIRVRADDSAGTALRIASRMRR